MNIATLSPIKQRVIRELLELPEDELPELMREAEKEGLIKQQPENIDREIAELLGTFTAKQLREALAICREVGKEGKDKTIMNEMQIFNYNENEVRTVQKDGEPWFVLKDVCGALGITKYRDVASRLDEDEREPIRVDTLGGSQEVICINESGLYNVILRSDKPQAKPFRKWVTSEVLPSIRKHGAYMTASTIEQVLLNPDMIIRIATELKKEQEANRALKSKIEEDEPKVLFANSVASSKTSILVGELAKLLKQNGVDIGQNRLFAWLRDNRYLIKRKGGDYNMPTQRAMESGLFEIKETVVVHADGHTSISKTPKVTGKGQQFFINIFLSDEVRA